MFNDSVVTLIAKGPSAIHAQEWIDAVETDVAVINEAGLLLRRDQDIHFGFFSHPEGALRMRPLWDKIKIFSGPSHFDSEPTLPPGFPSSKHVGYYDWSCCGDDQSLVARILCGGIAHHHTTTGAHHWLAKLGYKTIRVIGVDGGGAYADGMQGIGPQQPLDAWKEIHARLSDILLRVYGSETVWFK